MDDTYRVIQNLMEMNLETYCKAVGALPKDSYVYGLRALLQRIKEDGTKHQNPLADSPTLQPSVGNPPNVETD